MKKIFTLLFALTISFAAYSQGGFENWPLGDNGWHVIDNSITVIEETTLITQGASSASVEVTTTDQGETDLRTKIDVVDGTNYDICFDIYHTEGNIKARIYADDGVNFGYHIYSDNSITNQWQTICYTATANTTGKMEVGLRFYDQAGFDGSEIVYVDNLSVNGVTVPIVLSGFDVAREDNSTLVSWSTLSEENNDYFAVEWSRDGKDFKEIATINGAGSSRDKQKYSFTHNNPSQGVNYYRLAQYDFDGTKEIFSTVAVTFDFDSKEMFIVPNRVNNSLTIEFSKAVDNGRLHIFNMEGKKVQSFVLARGIDSARFDISNLVSGQYIVKYVDSNTNSTKRFVKL